MIERVRRRVVGLHRRARAAVYAYDFAKARYLLAQALEALDSAPAPRHQDLIPLRVRVLVSAAYADIEVGLVDIGLGRLDTADELIQDIVDVDIRAELAGLCREQRGFSLIRVGRTEDGLEVLDGLADILERDVAQGVGEPSVLAILYLNRSLAYIWQANTAAAIDEVTRCIELADRHDMDVTIGIKARHNLGYVAYMAGDMPTALRLYEESARRSQEQAPGLLSVVRLDQARAMLAAGLGDEAARHLDEALPALRKQRGGQDAAEAEVARAAAALLQFDNTLARRRARSAEAGFTRRGNTRWAAIAALTGIRAQTETALKSGRVRQALIDRAVKLAERLRGLMLEDETALALLLAARLELRRGNRSAAANILDTVPRPRATTPVDHQMLLRLCRAELSVANGNHRAALAEARAGLAELGRVRDRMGGLELVCGTAVHGQELGELAVRLVLEGPRPDARRLFGWLERTRAQVYRYEPLPAIDDPLVAEKATELRLARRSAQSVKLAGHSAGKLEKQTAALERELRQGWFTSPWGRPRPVATFDQVAPALGDRALVSFATSGGDAVAVVVAGSRARMVRLGSFAQTAEWAARLHADLNALAPDTLPAPIIEVVKASATRSANQLDAQLIQPLLGLIGDRELVIVPTGALYAVAWGGLPSLRGRPTVVAPSATAWLSAHGQRSAGGGRIVLARGPMLTGLVAEEAALREVYPDAVSLEGETATVAEVLAALDGAELAHLAAHGEHEPTNALFSRIELADGPLFAYEVARLRQPPRQVVLAACELALNYVRPGDEALGYAGALLAGGVRTVVAATSRVGDEAAATAMADYHRRLAAGVQPARALAESIAEDPYRRPFICLGAG